MPDRELSDAANVNRRGLLKSMAWAGSGVLWGLSGDDCVHPVLGR